MSMAILGAHGQLTHLSGDNISRNSKLVSCSRLCIRKTSLCNVYSIIPNFNIEKIGFAGVYLFFLFLLQNIDCRYSLELP